MTPHKPILFSTEMVQAILDGRKSMTRRTKGFENVAKDVTEIAQYDETYFIDTDLKSYKCPYGNVGDLLWVREKFLYVMREHAHDLLEGRRENNQWVYADDFHEEWMQYAKEKYGYKWKPSIHMPKAAARIWLKIEEIRVERLHEISEEDAIAEGISKFTKDNQLWKYGLDGWLWNEMSKKASDAFKTLWVNINGGESLDANPWVWVIKFSRTEKPSDVI